MSVITKSNYTTIDKIPQRSDYKKYPDIIIYNDIFNAESVTNVNKLLASQIDKNIVYYADNSQLTPEKSSPFPAFLDTLREVVEKLTLTSFNACVIKKYDNLSQEEINQTVRYDNVTDQILKSDQIRPYMFFGADQKINFKSRLGSDISTVDVKDGTILLGRKNVEKYWDVFVENDTHEQFFILQFMYIFQREKIPVNKKQRKYKSKINLANLPKVYLNIQNRLELKNLLSKGLVRIHENFPEGNQCLLSDGINYLKKIIDIGHIIGYGDWGNVYSSCLIDKSSVIGNCTDYKFAVKMSRITEDDLKDPYTSSSVSWYEIWILKDIFTHIIEEKICPNLPLLYDTFICGNCDLQLKGKDVKYPCAITIVELAMSDLRNYMESFGNTIVEDKIFYSALFQIMAALHSVQMTGQILNNDIKARNILCYDVIPGGYWSYKLGRDTFYVPNYGKMFILNDFGVSTLYNPNFQLYSDKKKTTFNLGSRYAINMDNKFSPIEATVEFSNNTMSKTKEVKWVDENGQTIQTSHGATYRLDRKTGQVIVSHTTLTDEQKSYLFKKGITTNPKTWPFFTHPYYIPPFEFYNDTQDVLRVFTAGKRTTQSGNHMKFPNISEEFKNSISPYMGQAVNSKERKFSIHPYNVLAGNFITKFFKDVINYTVKPNDKIIEEYNLNRANSRLW